MLPFAASSVTPLGLDPDVSDCSSTVASFLILLTNTPAPTPTFDCPWGLFICPVTAWENDSILVFADTVTSSLAASVPVALRLTPGAIVTLAVLMLSTTATPAPTETYSNAVSKAFSSPCSLPPCRMPPPSFFLMAWDNTPILVSPATLNSTNGSAPSPLLLSTEIPSDSTLLSALADTFWASTERFRFTLAAES